jgi:hypothetical protein
MDRLTTEKPVSEMEANELSHNCMIVRNRKAVYRDYDREIPLRDFIRMIAKDWNISIPSNDEEFDMELFDWLQYAPEADMQGALALINILGFALANTRERLKSYEDTGLTPEEIMDGKILTGWIPVAEQLPEYDGQYLVCFDDEFVATVSYETDSDGKQDWELWADSGEVIAWMRVPEPYKEDQP